MVILEEKIIQLLSGQEDIVIIGIDGGAGSGKSTLGEYLAEKFDANLFHSDDFFLRPEQRTPERFDEPGGNMDRERFEAEILSPLRKDGRAEYRPFSCSEMKLRPAVTVPPRRLNIAEGSYCLHPALSGYYDLKVFLDVPLEVRLERLKRREEDIAAFLRRWIPLEERYFEEFGIKNTADIVI